MREGRGGREWEKKAVWRGRQRRVRERGVCEVWGGWGGRGGCCSRWMIDESSH